MSLEVVSETETAVAEEDVLRATCYALLANLLRSPPDDELLRFVRGMGGDASEMGRGFANLAEAAGEITVEAASREYHDLFIGMTRGEVLPYASYYLAGYLYEKPLAELRGDMARLGVARAEASTEPEDHIASLFEMMAGLITGAFGAPAALADQRRFFEARLGNWAPKFFDDLGRAKAAKLYVPVAAIGAAFMRIEREAFAMTPSGR